MIENLNHSELVEFFNRMEKFPFIFHLTGSQYFAGHGNDFDFFVSYENEEQKERLVGFLRQNNFLPVLQISSRYGKDISVEGVYFNKRLNIHIQVISPEYYTAKKFAQNILGSSPNILIAMQSNKDLAAEIWRGLVSAHKNGETFF